MNKHRSLADALTTDPKKLEFIHGGKRPPELPLPNVPKEVASAAPEEKPVKASLTQAVVPFTTRFRQSTAEALRRASLERKLAGETPNSQQEIVELCVSAWLKSNGYLGNQE